MSSSKTESSNSIPSLCIPRVFPNITEERIRQTFDALDLGVIERVDMIHRFSDNGEKFKRVFIHFSSWATNSDALRAKQRILSGGEIKIIYDEPWFWKVSLNRSISVDVGRSERDLRRPPPHQPYRDDDRRVPAQDLRRTPPHQPYRDDDRRVPAQDLRRTPPHQSYRDDDRRVPAQDWRRPPHQSYRDDDRRVPAQDWRRPPPRQSYRDDERRVPAQDLRRPPHQSYRHDDRRVPAQDWRRPPPHQPYRDNFATTRCVQNMNSMFLNDLCDNDDMPPLSLTLPQDDEFVPRNGSTTPDFPPPSFTARPRTPECPPPPRNGSNTPDCSPPPSPRSKTHPI
jgi:hypothetical protein